MNKKELEKNILDLKYQFQMARVHASLALFTIGILAFIGTFIWYKERLLFGIFLSILVIIISSFYYSNAKRQLRNIIFEIRKLSKEQ